MVLEMAHAVVFIRWTSDKIEVAEEILAVGDGVMELGKVNLLPLGIRYQLQKDTWLKGLGIALLLRHRKRKNRMSNFRMQKMDHKALI
uniref:Uncharacterized protein n=1 Tax=Zea mays TaxID=4577 RepID=A0A804N2N4_MAIZE